jgi:hypothetical protein
LDDGIDPAQSDTKVGWRPAAGRHRLCATAPSVERTAMKHEGSRIVDSLPGLVWTALPYGRIDFVNQAGASTPASARTKREAEGDRPGSPLMTS